MIFRKLNPPTKDQIEFDESKPENEKVGAYLHKSDTLARAADTTEYAKYLTYLGKTFTALSDQGKRVFFVCPPGLGHTLMMEQVQTLIQEQYANQVSFINLSDAIDLLNTEHCFDGMHLTLSGNQIIAERLYQELLPVFD